MDISLVGDVPTVLLVLVAVRQGIAGCADQVRPHVDFKKRVPGAIGRIPTGDTTQHGNTIPISG